MSTDLIKYYSERAKEYESIYAKPERQEDLQQAAQILKSLFNKKQVLEIACGTGFWTAFIAQSASSVLATDINLSVIEIARAKKINNPNLVFEVQDIYKLSPISPYESLFAGFIWSHILSQDLERFYRTIHAFVKPGGLIVLMDNRYVEGSNHPITETDEKGNTYQTRKLNDGSVHKVLKNFPTENGLLAGIESIGTDIHVINLKYFWILSYRLK